jgi:hypothetical protein
METLIYLVRQEGLEPPTYRFEVCHSIQLSYWRNIYFFQVSNRSGHKTSGAIRVLRLSIIPQPP